MSAKIGLEAEDSKGAAVTGSEPVGAAMPGPNPLLRAFGWFVLALSGAFAIPLFGLARYAAGSELYSHILLLPFVSVYLGWLQRDRLPRERAGGYRDAWVPALLGAGVLLGYGLLRLRGWNPAQNDYLSTTIFSWFCFLTGGFLYFFGASALRALALPVGLLIFMAPFPEIITGRLETFLQHTSADAAAALFSLSGTSVFREGLVFRLPGIVIEVAKECSGIHSSLALLITSLLAGHLFLRSPWKKAVLTLAVIPLGIARNGFRIFTIAMLCVHMNPGMIDSPIHTRGGPIFFAVSLVPFVALLFWLRKGERLPRK